MNLFEKLLEIKTGKKNLMLKATYISNSYFGGKGSYFIYYYDLENHTFYINDLALNGTENRTSAINISERIMSKIYMQEVNFYGLIIKKILQSKEPKVFYFYNQKKTNNIIIDRVTLQTVKNLRGEITRFKNPTWESNSSEKYIEKNIN